MEKPELPKGMRSRTYRWVTAMVGLLFIVLAIAILATAEGDRKLGATLAAVVVGGLGVDAVVSAARNRLSILARIGPLP
ncbi:hypothetical protein VB780_29070 [Leptolyngbya sp. CCNP1308]|uniref:hypothetical protein n=1 Tax=Leptolyngbya sp. CCNP1308 TaxID=3110255 RepID=UPI002B1F1465|nr:hypothetical protein [Leptolyngbya sp. CCNP1308]MEA5452660.1 hypothetical protein [Leptolyngbya sp. CCNP1308]